MVVLLVLAILSLIAVLLFGRVRENAAEEVCRTNAAAMARNAEAIAGDAQAVTGAHLATAYAESSFPAGSSWDAGLLRCYNVACSDAGGAWPVGFDGTNYYSERTNTTDGTRTLHVTDSCGGLGGCVRTMLIPQGAWIRVAGTNGFASGAPSGWPNSGWCVPNGGEPLSASCNWLNGPGVAGGRSGYVQIG